MALFFKSFENVIVPLIFFSKLFFLFRCIIYNSSLSVKIFAILIVLRQRIEKNFCTLEEKKRMEKGRWKIKLYVLLLLFSEKKFLQVSKEKING